VKRFVVVPKIQRQTLTSIALLAFLSACAATSGRIHEFLDEQTGATITSSGSPFVLYRDNPSRAAYARNFLHLGPIEVNRAGTYEYFLWVGMWNTMDTSDSIGQRESFDSIVIFVDGEALPLEVAGRTPDTIGASRPVYIKPVASTADAYYAVTVDQIRLISRSSELRIRNSGTSPREYRLWDTQQGARRDMEAFLDAAFF